MERCKCAEANKLADGKTFRSAGFAAIFALFAMSIFGGMAYAAEEDELFSKIEGFPPMAHYCQIMVTQPGALSPSFVGNELSSRLPGGRSGYANVTATRSSYRIAVDAPVAFSNMPSNGDAGVRFRASYSATGNTNFGRTRGGVARKIKRGHTRIKTNLTARRQGSPFPQGQYSAQITLRCE